MKSKVLIFAPFYTPSVKGGGPIQSIKNIVANLDNRIDFYILTSDRDLGDSVPFVDVKFNEWIDFENVKVMYMNKKKISTSILRKIMKSETFDYFYLNSFFDYHFSVLPVLTMLLYKENKGKMIIAPRGEFSPGAIKLKSAKKKTYIKIFKLFCIHKKINWHVTADIERHQIQTHFGKNSSIKSANNLTANYSELNYSKKIKKMPSHVKFIFISRVTPKKNLLGAIKLLQNLKGEVAMSVYGPIEDEAYWKRCQLLINELPSNIKVTYQGVLNHNDIIATFEKHHFFLFPTFGENFGHVISESLIGGCPVIISDQTPWRNLEEKQVGWDISLNDSKKFETLLQSCVNMNEEKYSGISRSAFEFGKIVSNNKTEIEKTYQLFNF